MKDSLLPFEHLTRRLRHEGFRLGVEQHLRLYQLLERLDGRCTPHELKLLLCPILATSRAQQSTFYRVFDELYPLFTLAAERRLVTDPAPVSSSLQILDSTAEPGHEEVAVPRVRLWPIFVVAIVLLVIAGGGAYWFSSPSVPAVDVAGPGPIEPPPAGPPALESPPARPEPQTPPEDPSTASPAQWRNSLETIAVLAPIVWLLGRAWYRSRRRTVAILRDSTAKPPYYWPLRAPATGSHIYRTAELMELARLLRRREAGPGRIIDLPKTIAGTIRSLGFAVIRYRSSRRPTEYIALVQRRSPRDHQARMTMQLVQALADEDVRIWSRFYDDDLRFVVADDGSEADYLADIARRRPEARLLLFGDVEDLLHPVTGSVQSWASMFDAWPKRAVLTLRQPSRFHLEQVEKSGFIVQPATVAGLTLVARYFEIEGAGERERPPFLGVEPAIPLEAASLRASLGPAGYQWLCACAVIPDLEWNLTLQLGNLPEMGAGLMTEGSVARISRLPWFRAGEIPGKVRAALANQLAAPVRTAVQKTIVTLLKTDTPPEGSLAWFDRQATLRVGPAGSARSWPTRLRQWLERQTTWPIETSARDDTLLRLLEWRPAGAWAFHLPQRLGQLVYERGLRSLGLASGFVKVTSGLLTFGLAVFFWGAEMPSWPAQVLSWSTQAVPFTASGQAQRSFRAANDAYRRQDYREAARLYEETVTADPNVSQAYFYLGNSHDSLFRPAQIGDPENDAHLTRAVENYRLAVEKLAGSNTETDKRLRTLAFQYLVAAYGPDKLNDPARAEPILHEMIQLEPGEPTNYFVLAKLYEDAGRYDEAEALYQKASDVKPNDPAGYAALAGYYNRQGEFEKTMAALEQRAEKEPNNPEAHQTIASYYSEEIRRNPRLNDQQKREYIMRGLEASDRAIQLKSDYVDALVFKGLLLRSQALVEKDPGVQRKLLAEAVTLTDKANDLRQKQAPGGTARQSGSDGTAPRTNNPAPDLPQESASVPLRVGGAINPPRKLKDVRPTYPPIAQSARIQGIVIIEATIGTDGRVTKATVLRSIPLLDEAALDAVKQWVYSPTLLDGVPVEVIMTVTVNFTLE